MNLEAIKQAGTRLERAERALNEMRAATDYDAAEGAWSDFLLAASTFFSKLQQGAKGNGKSMEWLGHKIKQRRADSTLRYIRAARNSDEHGIERVTKRDNAGWPVPFGQQEKTQIQRVNPETGEPTSPLIDAYMYGHRIVAITAHDRRYNDTYDPPSLEGDGTFPPTIAADALEKLRIILEEAAELV